MPFDIGHPCGGTNWTSGNWQAKPSQQLRMPFREMPDGIRRLALSVATGFGVGLREGLIVRTFHKRLIGSTFHIHGGSRLFPTKSKSARPAPLQHPCVNSAQRCVEHCSLGTFDKSFFIPNAP